MDLYTQYLTEYKLLFHTLVRFIVMKLLVAPAFYIIKDAYKWSHIHSNTCALLRSL